ncbi:MAG: hypothetical protein ACLTQI_05880 [Slackia sp.]
MSRQTISNWENDKTYPDVQSLLPLQPAVRGFHRRACEGYVVAMQQAIAEDRAYCLQGCCSLWKDRLPIAPRIGVDSV